MKDNIFVEEIEDMDFDEHPCTNCGSKENCDQWDAQFCCILCHYEGTEHCEDCDPMDI